MEKWFTWRRCTTLTMLFVWTGTTKVELATSISVISEKIHMQLKWAVTRFAVSHYFSVGCAKWPNNSTLRQSRLRTAVSSRHSAFGSKNCFLAFPKVLLWVVAFRNQRVKASIGEASFNLVETNQNRSDVSVEKVRIFLNAFPLPSYTKISLPLSQNFDQLTRNLWWPTQRISIYTSSWNIGLFVDYSACNRLENGTDNCSVVVLINCWSRSSRAIGALSESPLSFAGCASIPVVK